MNMNRIYRERDKAQKEMLATEPGQRFQQIVEAIHTLENLMGTVNNKMAAFDRAVGASPPETKPRRAAKKRATNGSGKVTRTTLLTAPPPFPIPNEVLDLTIPDDLPPEQAKRMRGTRNIALVAALTKHGIAPTVDNLQRVAVHLGWLKPQGSHASFIQIVRRKFAKKTASGELRLTARGEKRLADELEGAAH
jgi:hypothetical protein